MADLIDKTRAKQNDNLAGLSDDQLDVLISAVSVFINRYYTIPGTVPADVEEAAVLLMVHIVHEDGLISDRLADWGKAWAAGSASFPNMATQILYGYKKLSIGPLVHGVDLS